MNNKLQAEICNNCQGRGLLPGSKQPCSNCRGVGAIGSDGFYEYYLEPDQKGNLKVTDVKSSVNSQIRSDTTPDTGQGVKQKQSIRRSLFLIMFIIFYFAFLGIYIFFIKSTKVFWIVSIIFGGFLLIYIISDATVIDKIARLVSKSFFRTADDFYSYVEKRKKT